MDISRLSATGTYLSCDSSHLLPGAGLLQLPVQAMEGKRKAGDQLWVLPCLNVPITSGQLYTFPTQILGHHLTESLGQAGFLV